MKANVLKGLLVFVPLVAMACGAEDTQPTTSVVSQASIDANCRVTKTSPGDPNIRLRKDYRYSDNSLLFPNMSVELTNNTPDAAKRQGYHEVRLYLDKADKVYAQPSVGSWSTKFDGRKEAHAGQTVVRGFVHGSLLKKCVTAAHGANLKSATAVKKTYQPRRTVNFRTGLKPQTPAETIAIRAENDEVRESFKDYLRGKVVTGSVIQCVGSSPEYYYEVLAVTQAWSSKTIDPAIAPVVIVSQNKSGKVSSNLSAAEKHDQGEHYKAIKLKDSGKPVHRFGWQRMFEGEGFEDVIFDLPLVIGSGTVEFEHDLGDEGYVDDNEMKITCNRVKL